MLPRSLILGRVLVFFLLAVHAGEAVRLRTERHNNRARSTAAEIEHASKQGNRTAWKAVKRSHLISKGYRTSGSTSCFIVTWTVANDAVEILTNSPEIAEYAAPAAGGLEETLVENSATVSECICAPEVCAVQGKRDGRHDKSCYKVTAVKEDEGFAVNDIVVAKFEGDDGEVWLPAKITDTGNDTDTFVIEWKDGGDPVNKTSGELRQTFVAGEKVKFSDDDEVQRTITTVNANFTFVVSWEDDGVQEKTKELDDLHKVEDREAFDLGCTFVRIQQQGEDGEEWKWVNLAEAAGCIVEQECNVPPDVRARAEEHDDVQSDDE